MVTKGMFILLALVLVVLPLSAQASGIAIGGPGAVSTAAAPWGPLGLLGGGDIGTATFEFQLSGSVLTLTVTNTSPAVTGTSSPIVPDAPVMSNMFFSVPSAVTDMSFVSAGGIAGNLTGWDFIFDPDNTPSTGFGFLKKIFDVGLEGGPGQGSPDPVIGSIFDPSLADEPGDPVTSPIDFVFNLTFGGGIPAGFSADWFVDNTILGDPTYIAAADFMAAANGGSATVTNGHLVPEPATLVLLATGAIAAGFGKYKNRKRS